MPTFTAYTRPMPPENCIQSQFALHQGNLGIVYKLRGGSAVFDPLGGPAYMVPCWRAAGISTKF